jgi:hypothetical protein
MDSRGEDQWNGRQMPAYHGRLGIKYGRVGSADGQKINYSDCHALPRCFSSRPRFCQNFSILSTPTFNVSNKFGTFGDGVLGQLTGQQQTHGSLNFSASDRRTFVVVCQTGSFSGDTFEDVVHETVHYAHSLTRDTGVGMDLFQHLVDVDGIALLPPALLFFVALGNVLLSFPGLLGCLTTCLRRHFSIQFNKLANCCDSCACVR